MSKKSRVSKVLAVLTVSVIAGVVTMVIFFKVRNSQLNFTTPLTDLRLPKNLLPESYQIFFQPHFYTRLEEHANGTRANQNTLFTGNSTVNFLCLVATNSIFLHSRNLTLSDPKVVNRDTNEEIGVSLLLNEDKDVHFLEVILENDLKEGGNYSLFLSFSREIAFPGVLLDSYIDKTAEVNKTTPDGDIDLNAQRFVVATHLEPMKARTLFPCFDEPEMRAEFLVTVVHRRGTMAYGNGEIAESWLLSDDWQFTRFHSTPKMSTYLLAFVVSEMDFKEFTSEETGITIRIHGQPEAIHRGDADYAGRITGNISDFFQRKFGLTYEMKITDQFALPELGPMGMENWGLITYIDSALLFQDGTMSPLQKEDIAVTIAHELAHQWFGNLVSIKWWNELWLKEGFATYMSYLAVDHVEPHFNMYEYFMMSDVLAALEVDALESSHPLLQPENEFSYDSITYSKGALMLRMLEDYMRPGDFQKGVNNYLQAFKLQSADTNDLWKFLQQAESSGKIQISEFMRPWISQGGIPAVTINTTNGAISQKQFFFNHTVESSLLWNIHVHFMTNSSHGRLELNHRGPVMTEQLIAQRGEWILANVNVTGFYLVNYDLDNWNRLLTQLETDRTRIPLLNRGQIISNAFQLARAKLVNVTLALNSTRFLREETEFLPWKMAMDGMFKFVQMLDRSQVYGPMQKYLRQQVEKLYNFFRNHTENSTMPKELSQQHCQLLAIKVACSNELQDCVSMATRKYAQWMKSEGFTNSIHPNLRQVLWCQAVAAGGAEEWDFAWKMYQKSSDSTEKLQLLKAMSCSRKIWLLNRFLDYTLDQEKISLMDSMTVFESISANPIGQVLLWNFIRANWHYIDTWDWNPVFYVSKRFSTELELEEMERLVNDQLSEPENFDDGLISFINEILEQTRANIQWVEENGHVLQRWFEQATQ